MTVDAHLQTSFPSSCKIALAIRNYDRYMTDIYRNVKVTRDFKNGNNSQSLARDKLEAILRVGRCFYIENSCCAAGFRAPVGAVVAQAKFSLGRAFFCW